MPCAFFAAEPECRCGAVDGAVIPSVYERERFCRTTQGYRCCPTFVAKMRNAGRLSVEDYFALWMPESSSASRHAK